MNQQLMELARGAISAYDEFASVRIESVHPLGIPGDLNPREGLLQEPEANWEEPIRGRKLALIMNAGETEHSFGGLLERAIIVSKTVQSATDITTFFLEVWVMVNPVALVIEPGEPIFCLAQRVGSIKTLLIKAYDDDGFFIANVLTEADHDYP